jgi:hypothetical protein
MLSLKTWEPTTYTVGGHPITFEVKRLGFTESKPFNIAFGKIRFDAPATSRAGLQRATSALTERGIGIVVAALEAAGVSVPARTEDADADFAAYTAALTAAGHRAPEVPVEQERELLGDVAAAARQVAEADAAFTASIDDAWVADVFRQYVRNVQGLEMDGDAITTGEALYRIADPLLILNVLKAVRGFSHLGETEKNGSSSPSPSAPGAEAVGGASTAPPAESADSQMPATATEIRPEPRSCSERAEVVAPV